MRKFKKIDKSFDSLKKEFRKGLIFFVSRGDLYNTRLYNYFKLMVMKPLHIQHLFDLKRTNSRQTVKKIEEVVKEFNGYIVGVVDKEKKSCFDLLRQYPVLPCQKFWKKYGY